MFIYLIVNHDIGKYYAGQHKGNNLKKYLQQKFNHAQRGISGQSYLYNSMRAHPDSKVWPIHALRSDIQTKEELNETERDFIKFLRSQDPEYGYNICRGGEGFTGPHTEETRKRISHIVKNAWKTPEKRKNMQCNGNHQSREVRVRNGQKLGKWGVETGHLLKISSLGSLAQPREDKVRAGKIGIQRGLLKRTKEQMTLDGKKGGLLGGKISCCKRWNIDRGKPCVCGKHLK